LPERDLRDLLAVIEAAHSSDPGSGLPWALLTCLQRVFHCHAVSFNELDYAERFFPMAQALEPYGRVYEQGWSGTRDISTPSRPETPFWLHYDSFVTCKPWIAGPDLSRIIRWSDIYTTTQLRNSPMYTDVFRPVGVVDCLFVSLPAPANQTRRLLLWRNDTPFSDHDQMLLYLLRPHLQEAHVAAEHRRHTLSRLTPREHQVVELLAHGHTNAEIARALVISVGTVRKHLEHIYTATGVHNRTAAAHQLLAGCGSRQVRGRRG